MKRKLNAFVSLLLIVPLFFITSCKKEDAQGEDLATVKEGWLTGTWKQTDILLAYAIPSPFGGTLPVGTSLHVLAPYLPFTGPKITATNDNVFTFDAKGAYNLSGSIDFMLPNTTNSGTWNMQVYGSALHLMSTDNEDTPLWVDKIDAENLKLGSLSTTVYIAEVDADIPVYFIFEKQ
ncbi:MAG TPA: hypothetical protein VFV68_14345 [Agriterribacter sp.]|nr:hypothetical protein [Agriterribacter sp.]